MKKYIIPVVALLLVGTIANAQTDKKQTPAKPASPKPATTGTKMAKPATSTKWVAADSTKHTAAAMKRKIHPSAKKPAASK